MASIAFAVGISGLLTGCSGFTAEGSVRQDSDQEQVLEILADLDDRTLSVEEQLANYSSDAVILAPDQAEIRGGAALREHLSEFGAGVELTTAHEIVELSSLRDMVVAQGKVTGTARPDGDPQTYSFETKNLILFKRAEGGDLKIWKVIYNAAPS